jgi:hypothetical protein
MERAMAGPSITGPSEAPEETLDRERIRAVIRGSREARRVSSAEPPVFRVPSIRAEQETRTIKPAAAIKKGEKYLFIKPLHEVYHKNSPDICEFTGFLQPLVNIRVRITEISLRQASGCLFARLIRGINVLQSAEKPRYSVL